MISARPGSPFAWPRQSFCWILASIWKGKWRRKKYTVIWRGILVLPDGMKTDRGILLVKISRLPDKESRHPEVPALFAFGVMTCN